jgi:hypothetical protein
MFNLFRVTLFLNLNVVFMLNFVRMAPSLVLFSQGFLSGEDFPERNLLQRAFRTPERLLSDAPFPRMLFQWSPERTAPAEF